MRTIVGMAVVSTAAKPVIKVMGGYYKYYGNYYHYGMQFVYGLFGHKKNKTNNEQHQRGIPMVMLANTMPQGMNAYYQGNGYHTPLKPRIV
jgi:hypothetical protein